MEQESPTKHEFLDGEVVGGVHLRAGPWMRSGCLSSAFPFISALVSGAPREPHNYAIAGGTEEPSALATEVLRRLGNAVGARECRVQRIGAKATVTAAAEHGSFLPVEGFSDGLEAKGLFSLAFRDAKPGCTARFVAIRQSIGAP